MSKLVAFRTHHGKYICAEPDGTLVANRDAIGPWETFEQVDVDGPASGGPPGIIPEPVSQDPRPELAGRLVQVTDGDGVVNRGYAYWPNAWLGPDGVALVLAPTSDGPLLYEVDPEAGRVVRTIKASGFGGTGEGMYFDREGFLYALDGPRLRRWQPRGEAAGIVFDISDQFPGCRLWQAHSSEDGQVHSATVQRVVAEGAYPNIGTVVWRRGHLHWFPSPGALDESQIDASGEYLLVKEGDQNIIVALEAGITKTLSNAAGALGHSDCGAGFAVGEDDQAGACVWMDLQSLARRTLFRSWNMGTLSIRGGRCLLSDATNRVLSLLDLETGERRPLIEHGMRGTGYEYQVSAALSPCGRLATFVSNKTGRFEMYLVVI